MGTLSRISLPETRSAEVILGDLFSPLCLPNWSSLAFVALQHQGAHFHQELCCLQHLPRLGDSSAHQRLGSGPTLALLHRMTRHAKMTELMVNNDRSVESLMGCISCLFMYSTGIRAILFRVCLDACLNSSPRLLQIRLSNGEGFFCEYERLTVGSKLGQAILREGRKHTCSSILFILKITLFLLTS